VACAGPITPKQLVAIGKEIQLVNQKTGVAATCLQRRNLGSDPMPVTDVIVIPLAD